MIVTVIAVDVMQVALHQVIDVIAMGYRFMATVGGMPMRFFMPVALVLRRASFRIGRIHLKAMVVHMIAM